MRKFLPVLPLLLLAGCYNDSATYYADATRDHTVTVRRQQDYFWSEEARYTLMASRLPDCQRAIPLEELPLEDTEFELYSSGDNQWSLRSGEQVWRFTTQTCALTGEGGTAAGQKVGVYHAGGDGMLFQEEAGAAAPAGAVDAPSPAQPTN
jgi:hypothetical protein